jgi:hypothetical protein
MMQRKLIQLALSATIVTILLAIASRPARACSCGELTDEEAFQGATAVFLGTVRSVSAAEVPTTRYGPLLEVTLDVARVWKGEVSRTQAVVTPNSGATCGVTFHAGRTYLVYVTRNASGFWASLCSGTRATDQAADELGLGPGSAPLEPRGHAGSSPPGRASCQVGGMGAPATLTGTPVFLLLAGLVLRLTSGRRFPAATGRGRRGRNPPV